MTTKVPMTIQTQRYLLKSDCKMEYSVEEGWVGTDRISTSGRELGRNVRTVGASLAPGAMSYEIGPISKPAEPRLRGGD